MKKIPVIYEDEDYILVNKPANLLSIPDRFNKEIPNLYEILKKKYENIFIVHRLDKETSGIICFAKNEEAHRHLSLQFDNRNPVAGELKRVEKIYLALVNGKLEQQKGEINFPIAENPFKKGTMMVNTKNGKEAITEFETLKEFKKFSLVKIILHTGKTHQIRVHFQYIGHPLAIDSVYGTRKEIFLSEFKAKYKKNSEREKPLMNRLSLHSYQLGFFHFRKKEWLQREATLPKDFEVLLKQLEKNGM